MNVNRKIDINKLIEIAKQNKAKLLVKDVSQEIDEAARFVLAVGIKEGKNVVLSRTIFEAYVAWKGTKHLNKMCFFKRFGKHFQNHISNSKNFYYLNFKPAELLLEATKLRGSYE